MMTNSYLNMLALIGEGSAHPGGFSATAQLLERLQLNENTKLLDVGCGTGRTACYAAQTYNCQVTGIDTQSIMIEKAKQRARAVGADVRFLRGNALHMPFRDNRFDVVMAESVTLFTPIRRAIKEYYRITKPGGRTINLELCKIRTIPKTMLNSLFGIKQIPTVSAWKRNYELAGYREVSVLHQPISFSYDNMIENEMKYPDHFRIESDDLQRVEKVKEKMKQVSFFLYEHAERLGYTIIDAKK